MNYFILAVDRCAGDYLTWWGPDNSGYTKEINEAGRYTEEQVRARADYYDNKRNTVAIPCALVEEHVVSLVASEHFQTYRYYTGIK